MKIKFSRVISLFMVLAILAVPLIAFAEANPEKAVTDSDNASFGLYEMNFLNSLKIVNYTEAKLEESVTNEEFASAAALIDGVTKDYYQDGILDYMIKSGNMLSSCAYPDRAIKYGQAIKALVSVLGYDSHAAVLGGYPNGYLLEAKKLKLTTGLENINTEDTLTYGQLCVLLYNCLDVNRIVITSYDGDGGVGEKQKDTVLKEVFGIYESNGRVNANSVTSLWGDNTLNVGKIHIDTNEYLNTNAEYDEFLGYNVRFYYAENQNGLNEILYMEVNQNDNRILTVRDRDSGTYDKGRGTYSYYQNNRLRTLRISSGYCLVYNNRVSDKGLENYIDNINGQLTFVDTDNDGKYDFVEIMSYSTIYVSKTNEYAEQIFDKYAVGKSVCLDDSFSENKIVIQDVNGNDIKFADIKTGDVVSALLSEDQKIVTAIVSSEKITLVVDELSSAEDKYNIFVRSNKQKYPVSVSMAGYLKDIEPGVQYQFALDLDGNIAGFERSDSLFEAGLIMKTVVDTTAFMDSVPKIMIYTTGGKVVRYDFGEKVVVDGTLYKDAAKAHKALYIKDNSGNDVYKSKFIRFRTRNDLVVEIDTAFYDKANESEKSLHAIGTTGNKTINRDGQFFYTANGDGVVYDSAVTIFMEYMIEGDETDENGYSIVSVSDLPAGYSIPNVTGYTTDLKNPDTQYVTIGMTNSFVKQINSTNIQAMCLEGIGEKFVDGETKYCVSGWDLLKDAALEITVDDITLIKDFNKGDVFAFCLNMMGEFATVYKAYDAKSNSVTFTDEVGISGAANPSGGNIKWIYGKPYAAANNFVYMIPDSLSGDMSARSLTDCKMVAHKRRTPHYYIFDTENLNRKNMPVTAVNRTELRDYVNTAAEADTILVLSYPAEYSAVIIFR